MKEPQPDTIHVVQGSDGSTWLITAETVEKSLELAAGQYSPDHQPESFFHEGTLSEKNPRTDRVRRHSTMTDKPDAPDGWHWAIGSRGSGFYTHWLYTDRVLYPDGEFGYEAEIYWDEGGGPNHHVAFYPITRLKPDGEPEVGEYPCRSATAESEAEALQRAVEIARDLR